MRTPSPTLPAHHPSPCVAHLQCGQVASQLFDDGLKSTGLGLGITHEAQVEEQGIAAVLLVLNAHRAADQFLLHGCARWGTVGKSQVPPSPKPIRSPCGPLRPARASHSDELVLQLWLGDDVHLDCVKQLPGDEVLRDLGRGVAVGPLGDPENRWCTQGDPQGSSPLLWPSSSVPSTQACFSFVFSDTGCVLTCLLAFSCAAPFI